MLKEDVLGWFNEIIFITGNSDHCTKKQYGVIIETCRFWQNEVKPEQRVKAGTGLGEEGKCKAIRQLP